MIVVLYSTPYPFRIYDYGFRALLRISDRLHGLSRTYRVPYYDVPFTIRLYRPPRYILRRYILALMDFAIFLQVCFIIYVIFTWLF